MFVIFLIWIVYTMFFKNVTVEGYTELCRKQTTAVNCRAKGCFWSNTAKKCN